MKLLVSSTSMITASGLAMACPSLTNPTAMNTDHADAPAAFINTDDVKTREPFAMQLEICDADLADQTIRFDAIMPAHQHGMNYDVDIAPETENRHAIRNIVFHMPGLWEIQVELETGADPILYTTEVTAK